MTVKVGKTPGRKPYYHYHGHGGRRDAYDYGYSRRPELVRVKCFGAQPQGQLEPQRYP